jgi:hypothetical protein
MVYVGQMAKRAFDKVMAGVNEARAYLEGTADKSRYRVHAARKRNPPPISAAEEKCIQRGIAADPSNPEPQRALTVPSHSTNPFLAWRKADARVVRTRQAKKPRNV